MVEGSQLKQLEHASSMSTTHGVTHRTTNERLFPQISLVVRRDACVGCGCSTANVAGRQEAYLLHRCVSLCEGIESVGKC